MTRRYFVPCLPDQGGPVDLPEAEALHAVRVMRVQVGEELELFDGKGNQARAVVTGIKRNACECEADRRSPLSREPSIVVDLGIALPKPDRSRELVERLTELGVRSVTPLVADRSQRAASDSVLEKLSRTVIEACKQCGRNHLMEIHPTQAAVEYFAEPRTGSKLIAHPSIEAVTLASVDETQSVTAAIGPEGGWTEEEVENARASGFQPLNLGSRIYRIETAAAAIAAVLVCESI